MTTVFLRLQFRADGGWWGLGGLRACRTLGFLGLSGLSAYGYLHDYSGYLEGVARA